MDFITTEQVQDAAEKGELPALEASLLHHQQGRDANWVELRDAIEDDRFFLGLDFCSCCLKWACDKCPLTATNVDIDERCCDGAYSAAKRPYEVLKRDYSNANFEAFQEAEGKICTYIEGVIAKKKAEEKSCEGCKFQSTWVENISCGMCRNRSRWQAKESTPALRHLDYGINDDGHIRLVIIERHSNNPIVWNKYGIGNPNGRDPKKDIWLGNLADDLARNAEDLDNYETTTKFNGSGVKLKIGVTVNPVDLIYFKVGGTYNGHQVHANIDEATEIHRKLGQLIATAIRKK